VKRKKTQPTGFVMSFHREKKLYLVVVGEKERGLPTSGDYQVERTAKDVLCEILDEEKGIGNVTQHRRRKKGILVPEGKAGEKKAGNSRDPPLMREKKKKRVFVCLEKEKGFPMPCQKVFRKEKEASV